MKVIALIQDTDPWLEWRKSGIGASVVSSILGVCPYKTAYVQWGELCGFFEPDDLSNNPNIKRGNLYEPVARRVYENHSKDSFEPICIESDMGAPFIASLDGYSSKTKRVLEIKCPAASTWADIKANKRLSKSFRLYYNQVQYQMLCCDGEATSGVLFFYFIDPENKDAAPECLAFDIAPNLAYQAWLKDQVLNFWRLVQTQTPPLLDPDRDVITPEVSDGIDISLWTQKAYQLVEILHRKKSLEDRLKQAKAEQKAAEKEIIDLLGGFKIGEIQGVKLSSSHRRGRVGWEKAYNQLVEKTGQSLSTDDLDELRGSDSHSVRISINKKSGEDITTELISQKAQELGDAINTANTYQFSL